MTEVLRFISFQSTLPRGERQDSYKNAPHKFWISIHAPARGATLDCVRYERAVLYFNPRSREGSDSTIANVLSGNFDFNPRSREGSDTAALHSGTRMMLISIHAPARGATDITNTISFDFLDFNPRSREGSD